MSRPERCPALDGRYCTVCLPLEMCAVGRAFEEAARVAWRADELVNGCYSCGAQQGQEHDKECRE